MTYSNGESTITLKGTPECWTRTLTTGYYYPIELYAINEGRISPNTGAISVSTDYSSPQQSWNVNLGQSGQASVVIRP